MTEYLYDRENPKSKLAKPITGIQTLFKGLPNDEERAEMVYRVLWKQNDGNLVPFGSSMNKPRDYAQKWRTIRLNLDLVKNPFGFIHWRALSLIQRKRVSGIYLIALFNLIVLTSTYSRFKNQKEYMKRKWFNSTGEVTYLHDKPWLGKYYDVDRKKQYEKWANIPFFCIRNQRDDSIFLNFWCRDQNFRKYFEMRKKNGILPSEHEFAHLEEAKKYKTYHSNLMNIIHKQNSIHNPDDLVTELTKNL